VYPIRCEGHQQKGKTKPCTQRPPERTTKKQQSFCRRFHRGKWRKDTNNTVAGQALTPTAARTVNGHEPPNNGQQCQMTERQSIMCKLHSTYNTQPKGFTMSDVHTVARKLVVGEIGTTQRLVADAAWRSLRIGQGKEATKGKTLGC
jgi:hypothetical protein